MKDDLNRAAFQSQSLFIPYIIYRSAHAPIQSLQSSVPMSNHGSVTPLTEPKTETDVTPKRQPPYAVILHNDDVNTMEYVVSVLRRVFGYNMEKCVVLMLEAHNKERVAVWSGALELAELKADQIVSCGADPDRHQDGAEPLRVSVEPIA